MDEVSSLVLPLIAIAFTASLLLAFDVVLPFIKKTSESKSRTSLAMALNLQDDIPSVRDLVDRVCVDAQHPWDSWETPIFTRYTP
jgi:hypothetical protein